MSTDNAQYIIWDTRDGTFPGLDRSGGILGGPVGYGSCYISIYPEVEGDIPIKDLAVGQWVWAEYRLSGSKGRYQIWRVA